MESSLEFLSSLSITLFYLVCRLVSSQYFTVAIKVINMSDFCWCPIDNPDNYFRIRVKYSVVLAQVHTAGDIRLFVGLAVISSKSHSECLMVSGMRIKGIKIHGNEWQFIFVSICSKDISTLAYRYSVGRPRGMSSLSTFLADNLFSFIIQLLFLVQVSW